MASRSADDSIFSSDEWASHFFWMRFLTLTTYDTQFTSRLVRLIFLTHEKKIVVANDDVICRCCCYFHSLPSNVDCRSRMNWKHTVNAMLSYVILLTHLFADCEREEHTICAVHQRGANRSTIRPLILCAEHTSTWCEASVCTLNLCMCAEAHVCIHTWDARDSRSRHS